MGWGIEPRKNFAEAETLGTVEGNMCGIAMRNAVAPPGSKAIHNNPAGKDLVLLVSVASNVEPAFAATRPKLHELRGFVTVAKTGNYPHDLETAGQARDVVRVVVEGLRRARDVLQPRGTLHVFLSVLAGLAVMIGQMLNTFGPVQTYEHLPTDAVGVYEPAAPTDSAAGRRAAIRSRCNGARRATLAAPSTPPARHCR
jgi:hypothetical protein